MKRLAPVILTSFVLLGYVFFRLDQKDMDPVQLAEIGTRYAEGDPQGTEGYDGQFTFYMALDLSPEMVEERLDIPSYRYQRILLPLLGRALGGGKLERTAWALLGINLVGQLLGTWLVARLLEQHGWHSWYSLIYGLWVGLVMPVGLMLHEPLAYALAVAAVLLHERKESPFDILLALLAVLAKETTLFVWLSLLLVEVFESRSKRRLAWFTATAMMYAVWQLWLYQTFGAVGLGSGGANATGFEWIPFNGLWRIGAVSPRALLLYSAAFGPGIVLPALWGLLSAVKTLFEDLGRGDAYMLAANCAGLMFLPHSTFREPLGLIRFADGLVFSLLYYAAIRGNPKVLRYALFWIAMLAMLFNG